MGQTKKAGIRTISRAKALRNELVITEIKGALSSLFHYTNIESFANIVASKCIWLSRIDRMNDGTEVFKEASRTYAFCMTAVPTESVGMWIAYGVPRRDAIRVRFSGKAIHEIFTAHHGRVEVHPVKSGLADTARTIQGEISLQYVGYVSRNGDRVHVRNKIFKFAEDLKSSREEVMNSYGSFIKWLGWAYEHEIRLVVQLDKEIDADKIQLDISGVVEKALTYKSKKRNATQGMPSVVVGPWSNCEDFIRKFSSKIEDRADREDVGYFLEHAADDAPLVRESEFAGKIHLGRCTNCNKKDACDCGYCEVKGCML